MAILCLASSLEDLRARLGHIVVGYTREKKPVFARDLKAQGAMLALLKDALKPISCRRSSTLRPLCTAGPLPTSRTAGQHTGHGIGAARGRLRGDRVWLWSGPGGRKVLRHQVPQGGPEAEAAVVVASVRALKLHGGAAKAELGRPNVAAVSGGLANLRRHLTNLQRFGVPALVCVNRFGTDSQDELDAVVSGCAQLGVQAIVCEHWAKGAREPSGSVAR